MNWRSIRAIALKDYKEVRQNKAAWIPALVLPLIFAVAMPLGFTLLPQLIPTEDVAQEMGDLQDLIVRMPPAIQQIFAEHKRRYGHRRVSPNSGAVACW